MFFKAMSGLETPLQNIFSEILWKVLVLPEILRKIKAVYSLTSKFRFYFNVQLPRMNFLKICVACVFSFYMKLSILIFEAEYSFPVITVSSSYNSTDIALDQQLHWGTSSLRVHKSEKEVKSVCHRYHIHSAKRCILGQGYTIERNICLELHHTEAAFCRKPSSMVSRELNAVLQLESWYKWAYKTDLEEESE